MTHYIQKLANILGFDSETVLLKQAVIRKDKDAVINIITGLKDPSSVNRSFHWKTIECTNAWVVGRNALGFALALGDHEIMDVLLSHGAKFNENNIGRAAMYIIENQEHPEIKKYIAVCEKHKIDWSLGKVYTRQGESRTYYGTTEMMLLVHLKRKAFDLGLFPQSNQVSHQQSVAIEHGSIVVAAPQEIIANGKILKL